MTRAGRLAIVAALTLGVGSAHIGAAPQVPSPASGQVPTFRAHADVVSVDVSVRRGTRPVRGLQAADFELFDNGIRQQPTLSLESLPIDVTVLLDVSGSVTGPVRDQLRRSVSELRADLTPGDRLRLLAFNMRVDRVIDFEAPASAIDEAFARLVTGGSSAVFDALSVALAMPVAPGRRAFIAVFTDGQDNSSIVSPTTLLNVARRTSPSVNAVLATPLEPGEGDVFRALATETGGRAESLRPGERLGSAFRSLLEQFRASYVLRYTPTGVERLGAHSIDVRVNRPDVDVRARRGYVVGR